MRRQTLGYINVDLTFGVHRDGVEVQRRSCEISNNFHGVNASCCVDLNFFDVPELTDDLFACTCIAGDDDIGPDFESRAGPGIRRIDAEGLVRTVAVDDVEILAHTAVHDIAAAADAPGDLIVAITGHQEVVACAAGDGVTSGTGIDDQTLVRQEACKVDDLLACRPVHEYRVRSQRGLGKVADRIDRLDPQHAVDGDFLDPADFHDRGFDAPDGPCDDDLGQRLKRYATAICPRRHGIHRDRRLGPVGIDRDHVKVGHTITVGTTVDDIVAAIRGIPDDYIDTKIAKDHVIASATVDLVVTVKAEDGIVERSAREDIIDRCARDGGAVQRSGTKIDILIRKTDDFDIRQPVGSVSVDGIGATVVRINRVRPIRDIDMADRDAAIGVAEDDVVFADIVVHRHVHITCLPAIEDFAHDFQLAGVDRPVEQFRCDFCEAVDRAQFDRRIVGVTNRDADVEVFVPIDHVVAATALDGVAAAAAQKDVAAREGLQRTGAHQIAHQLAKARDAVYASLVQIVAEEGDIVVDRIKGDTRNICYRNIRADPVIAEQPVVKLGARGRFDVVVTVREHVHAGQFQTPGQVDIGPDRRVLVGNPVMAQTAFVRDNAFALDQDVVAAFAPQIAVVGTAIENVMADGP